MTISLYGTTVGVDPQLGPIAIFSDVAKGKPVLRAWDMRAKRPLWDQLAGEEWVSGVDRSNVAVVGHNVYVANGQLLYCFDLAGGHQRWAARVAEKLDGEEDGRLWLGDPYAPGVRGAIVVVSENRTLYGLDRETGGYLWERQLDQVDHGEGIFGVQAVPGMGICILRTGGNVYARAEVVNPALPNPIAIIGDAETHDIVASKVFGRVVVSLVDGNYDTADGGKNGIIAFDALTGKEIFFDPIDGLDEQLGVCAIGGHVFAVLEDDKGFYAGPHGRTLPPPLPDHRIGYVVAAGSTLAMLLVATGTSRIQRVVGLDPQTLAVKFDTGGVGSDPGGETPPMASDGSSIVYAAAPSVERPQEELRSIDAANGHPLWSLPAPSWERHHFENGLLVLVLQERIDVIVPATGQVIASMTSASST